jgi:hypothetical protein
VLTNNQDIAFQLSFFSVEGQLEAVFQKGLQHPAVIFLIDSLGDCGLNVKAVGIHPSWAADLE